MPSKNVSYSCCICGQLYKEFDKAEKCEKPDEFAGSNN